MRNQPQPQVKYSPKCMSQPKSPNVHEHMHNPYLMNDLSNQVVYDESLNPIFISNTPNRSHMHHTADSNSSYFMNNEAEADVTGYDKNEQFFHHQQQQIQTVWLPRDDMQPNESSPAATSTTTYNPNQHKPQYPLTTLCNGKELPADLKIVNPAFTIRRHIVNAIEDNKQVEALKKIIEHKLKVQVDSDDLGVYLSDGVVLCHLINQIFPRSIHQVHTSSASVVIFAFLCF